MEPSESFQLESRRLGSVPLVDHYLRRLRVKELFEKHLETEGLADPGPAECAGLIIRNIIVARSPLYQVREWATSYHEEPLGLLANEISHVNDDRLGRVLDRIFDADRATMLTELVLRAISEFRVDLAEIHNDTTTITLHGDYDEADGRSERGKKTAAIERGYNKDHRPDLKQLIWNLCVSADGAVPVHYTMLDGSTEDSTVHRDTWDALCALRESSDFLYVADCKLCTEENLKHIDSRGGRFLCIIPRRRTEDTWFRDHLQTHPDIPWERVHAREERERADKGLEEDPNADRWHMYRSPIPSGDGFLVLWLWSAHKEERDRKGRRDMIARRMKAMEGVAERVANPRSKLNTRDRMVKAVEEARGEDGRPYILYRFQEDEDVQYKQARRGRPGPNTAYRKESKTRTKLVFWVDEERVRYDSASDGMWPMVTNWLEGNLQDCFDAYKYQPRLEKRHEQLKNVYEMVPVWLKKVTRIEGLAFLMFISELVGTLIERQVRDGMKEAGIEELKVYPEDRGSPAPSTDRILKAFDLIQIHRLIRDGECVQLFQDPLSEKITQILELAEVPVEAYTTLK